MNDQDKVGVTFVSTVVGRGLLNNVANLTFSTYNFSPTVDGIEADPVISCRLRMDVACLRQLHQSTGELLAAIDSKEKEAPIEAPVASQVDETPVTKRSSKDRAKVN